MIECNIAITAADLQNQALVLTKAEFNEIGPFDIMLRGGKQATLDPKDFHGDILIIYPEHLG